MRITKSILENKCADVNYLRGSAKPFDKVEGNYYIEKTVQLDYSICEVMNGYKGIHRIQSGMTATDCYSFLLGMEYALVNLVS